MPKVEAIRQDDRGLGKRMYLVIPPPINIKQMARFFGTQEILCLHMTQVFGSPQEGILVTCIADDFVQQVDIINKLETIAGVKVTTKEPFKRVNCSSLPKNSLTMSGSRKRPETTIFVKIEENQRCVPLCN